MTGHMPDLSTRYTLTCLARLDIQIRREVIRLRLGLGQKSNQELPGLYISDEQVNFLLDQPEQAARLLDPNPLPEEVEQSLQQAERIVEEQITFIQEVSSQKNIILRLERLAELFGLSELEREVVVICLAPEVDLKYERLYAYLQDDVTRKRPTLDLLMRLLCPTVEARLAARKCFEPGSPLLAWELVSLHEDPGVRRPTLPAKYLKLDERIAGYLLGSDQIDGRLQPLVDPWAEDRETAMPPAVKARLEQWLSAWERTWQTHAPVLLMHGRQGAGNRAAAFALAQGLGKSCLLLNAARLELGSAAQIARLAEREALLSEGIISWDQADTLLHPDPDADHPREQRAFLQALANGQTTLILHSTKLWDPGAQLSGRPFLCLEFPDSTFNERRDAWTERLNGSNNLSEVEILSLAGRFRLTPSQIQNAVARAKALAWARDPASPILQKSDLEAASRDQSQNRLGTLARKLIPRYRWEDIVLPRPQMSMLRMISATVRQRPTVYGDWGFDRKLSLGKGLIALFSGPSGTGKTMSAEIIANDLGLDLYKINLSAVVSKYIGETEKNLEHIFSEAQDSDAILFFDEADALFGKRSEVKDAHDRYANIETAYLLQRTEEYNGLVILASNIKKNMDEAFIRRIHFLLEFPFPEETERLEIWRRTFPAQAPRAQDIDLPFLARKLKIAGGNIRNIILTAAFIAAEEQEPICMRHLVRGASYEYQKMGKMIVEGDFEGYFSHARN